MICLKTGFNSKRGKVPSFFYIFESIAVEELELPEN
jgi:hypothetical protein